MLVPTFKSMGVKLSNIVGNLIPLDVHSGSEEIRDTQAQDIA